MRYIQFCPEFLEQWLYVEKQLNEKDDVISKFMTSTTQQNLIAIYIFPNISRSKENQKTKFGQLIKYNVRDIFLKNHLGRKRL